MIRNIITPDRIGSYYLFSQRIVGIDITRTSVYATIVKAHGHKRIIEKFIEEPLSTQSGLTQEERIAQALRTIKNHLGKYTTLSVAFASSSVVFKELTIPFVGLKKIKMIVPFEVEALLPFSLDQAVLDSIVTHENIDTKATTIFVAAVKQEHIAAFMQPFIDAQLPVDRLSVDIFELYSLYKSIPFYGHTQNMVALVDISLSAVRLALIVNGQLKYIRTLPTGIIHAAKKIASLTQSDSQSILEYLMRFGLEQNENPEYTQASQQVLQSLCNDIEFTINAYIHKLKENISLKEVIIAGVAADIPGIQTLMSAITKVKSEILNAKTIMHNTTIQSKITTLPNSFVVSLATALSLPITQEFNLLQEQEKQTEESILNKQLIALAALSLFIPLAFSTYSYLRVRTLKNTLKIASNQAIQELKKSFKLKDSDTKDLDAANKKAKRQLEDEESTWQRLSDKSRYSFLKILGELSKCINFKELTLDLQRITIKDKTIELYGSVPDYKNLDILQRQLECPLFNKIGKLNETTFKSTPIKLTVKDEEEL
jgi:Tfp pilus assembly PilM family ATPase